jgi:hypothetical protein
VSLALQARFEIRRNQAQLSFKLSVICPGATVPPLAYGTQHYVPLPIEDPGKRTGWQSAADELFRYHSPALKTPVVVTLLASLFAKSRDPLRGILSATEPRVLTFCRVCDISFDAIALLESEMKNTLSYIWNRVGTRDVAVEFKSE